MTATKILILIVAYIIGVMMIHGLLFQLYDEGLLGDIKYGWIEFLVLVWPVTIIASLILFMINLLILIGRGAGSTLSRILRWFYD